MLLLHVAHPGDPWRPVLAATAAGAGHRVVATDGFAGLDVELRVAQDGRARTVLRTSDGEDVGGVVHRGGVWSAELDPFVAAERVAAWWGLLAGFDGPVVNRPTRHGLLCTPDRLRTRRSADVWPGGAVLRASWPASATALRVPVARTASQHRPVGARSRPGRSPHVRAGVEVLDVTTCTPGRVVRVAVAGRTALVLGADGASPLAEPYATVLATVLAPDLPLLATVVVEIVDGTALRVLDIDPVPHPGAFGAGLTLVARRVVAAAAGGGQP
ncbi:hypothetical protein ACWFNE_02085 [Cellulomonas sp. NPDC055163]